MKKFIRKATRVGKRSMAVVIPSELIEKLRIREKQKLAIRQQGQRIVIEDWNKED